MPARYRLVLVDPREPEHLTPSELQVAALVAEGLSNREIGRRLSKSHNTVCKQVRGGMRKTGSANRTGLAVWYVAQKDQAD